jgi:hypothetical protein
MHAIAVCNHDWAASGSLGNLQGSVARGGEGWDGPVGIHHRQTALRRRWDEAGYTAWPQFKETGVPVPMIWEGKKGEPSKPVMPLDLNVRPIVDEKYIIPKTIEYIQRNAAAKKPFFVYVATPNCTNR